MLEELEDEDDGVLLVSELEVALVSEDELVPDVFSEPLVEPLAEPLALMSVLEDDERVVSVEELEEAAGVEDVDWSVLMSELLRVDLLQPPRPSASAARAAAPVSVIFCVFMIFLPKVLIV